jgi:hypothetical protein
VEIQYASINNISTNLFGRRRKTDQYLVLSCLESSGIGITSSVTPKQYHVLVSLHNSVINIVSRKSLYQKVKTGSQITIANYKLTT